MNPNNAECLTFQGYEGECLRCGKPSSEHPPKDWPDMSQVIRVLRTYGEEMNRLAPKWDEVQTESDVYMLIRQESELLTQVRLAFWQATKDRNNWNHCRVVDIGFIRQIAKGWLAQQHEPGCFYPANRMPCSCTPRRKEI